MLTQDNSLTGSPKIIVGRQTHAANDCKPEITVEKTGELISRVLVKCTCGEVIEIDCQYGSGETK